MSKYSIKPYKFFGYPRLRPILEYENIDYITTPTITASYYVNFTDEELTLFILTYDNGWFNIRKCKDE